MRKLLSAIEYWELLNPRGLYNVYDMADKVVDYDEYISFLKQPLQLGFFIPCDKDGKPLEKPKRILYKDIYGKYDERHWKINNEEYQQACDRKIFTGFELYQDTYFNDYNCVIRSSDMVIVNIENKTIEDIAPLQVDLVEKVCKQFKY